MPRTRRKKEPALEKRLRIFCEGEKTEPYYLKDYLRNFKDDRKASVEIMNCNKNTPVQLVEAAIKFKNYPRSIIGDVFWVVYDRESVAKYSRELHMQAWSTARQNNIEVALSNVCFEFWLLLHFVNSATPYSSCSDLLKIALCQIELSRHVVKNTRKPLLFYSSKSRIIFLPREHEPRLSIRKA